MACGILVPLPGIEPRPSAVKAQSPNHWTTREFPQPDFKLYRTLNLPFSPSIAVLSPSFFLLTQPDPVIDDQNSSHEPL